MDIGREPFIGSEALAQGALSRHELRRHYRALLPNVYLDKRISPSLHQRIAASWLWSCRKGVVAGMAASSLHGSKWVGDNIPIELVSANARPPQQVVTRADLLLDGEIQCVDGMAVTTPERTAFDLGRRGRLVDAVARLDALSRATGFEAADVGDLAGRHRHTRGLRQLAMALDLFDSGGASPKETWLRLMLIEDGFPRPETQIPVLGPDGHARYYLDMGWQDIMLAVEYDGVQHADQLGYDIERQEYLMSLGWVIIRVAAGQRRPQILYRVNRAWRALAPQSTLR